MEAYIQNGGLPPFYKCNKVVNWTFDEWLLQGDAQPELGFGCLIYGSLCILLYLPCCYVLLSRDLFAITAYKFLFVLSLIEMGNLTLNSLWAGAFFIKGIVFCNYPNLIYVLGCFVMTFWCGGCVTCFFLGMSRLIDLWNPKWHDILFGGKRIVFSIIIILLYMSFMFFFAKAAVFNSRALTWQFDPLIYPNGSYYMVYASFPTEFNNIGTTICTLVITLTFITSFVYKYKKHNFKMTTFQKQLFVQSTVACFNSLASALIYVSYSYIPINRFVNYLGLLTWQISSAGELFVFLLLNRTIRRRVLQLFHFKIQFQARVQPGSTNFASTNRPTESVKGRI